MGKSCFVYVIGTVSDGLIGAPVKVGIARNPRARLSELQTGNPNKLAIAFSVPTGSRQEAAGVEFGFHASHAEERLTGEWFNVTPDHAAYVVNTVAHLSAMRGKE